MLIERYMVFHEKQIYALCSHLAGGLLCVQLYTDERCQNRIFHYDYSCNISSELGENEIFRYMIENRYKIFQDLVRQYDGRIEMKKYFPTIIINFVVN